MNRNPRIRLNRRLRAQPESKLYWAFGDGWAVRDGDLKLVQNRSGAGKAKRNETSVAQLFDLSKDVSEKSDLATSQPGEVVRLKALFDKWKATHQPSPWGKDDDK